MTINYGILSPLQQTAQPQLGGGVPMNTAPRMIPQQPQDDGIGNIVQGLGHLINTFKGPQQPNSFNSGELSSFSPNYQQNNINSLNQDLGFNDLQKTPAYQTAKQAQDIALQSGTTKSPIMTVVDFSRPANQKRLWVIDSSSNKVLMNTYVAQGSGGFNYAPGSHGSETGTFLTGDEYYSKNMNRNALKINGLDKGVNDNAFARGIVVHGGNYVGKDKSGTSWGCFAVPNEDAPKLIGLTKNGTIIHAYAPDPHTIKNFANQLSHQGKQSLVDQLFQKYPNQQPFKDVVQKINNDHPINFNQYMPKDADKNLPATMAGIAHVESGSEKDPYMTLGKMTKSGDRAYGKYQIMGSNIPAWTKAATGVKMSKEEFLHNPAAQEKTAAYVLNQSLKKGYSPQDTAAIWFSGRPERQAGKAKDAYGTSVPEYIRSFNKGAGFNSKNSNIGPQSNAQPVQKMPMMANSYNPNIPPNIPAFNPQVPIRQLSPQEQAAIMRWNSGAFKSLIG